MIESIPMRAHPHPSPPDTHEALLEDLTSPQREAVEHVEGPLLVLAGAGSGKTRVITRRVAHLILAVGIPPWNIAAITFTNKAASEMRQRVGQLVSPQQARAVTISTFHSLCARILRHYADRLNLPRSFSIYDSTDQARALKQAMEDLQIRSGHFEPNAVRQAISKAKNELVDPQAYAASADDFYRRQVARMYGRYEQILVSNDAMDFDDLLLKTVQLVHKDAEVLGELRQRLAYVLIDEYQDTNHVQFTLAHVLAAEHRNLCATGDPDQAIYSWRGADIRNILEFEQHYSDAKVVRLEQNYRSTKRILVAADRLIQNNRHRKAKSLWTENETGDPIRVITCADEHVEARSVIEQFQQLRDRHELPWSDFAIFYRVNWLSRVLEEALMRAAIPYQVARGTAFYDRKEVKDTLAYLRVIANPADQVNLLRIINTPARGVSSRSVKAMQAHAAAQQTSLVAVLADPAAVAALTPRAVQAVQTFYGWLQRWQARASLAWRAGAPPAAADPSAAGVGSLASLIEAVLRESGLEDHYQNDKQDPDRERLANVGELLSAARQFEQEQDEADSQDQNQDPDPATGPGTAGGGVGVKLMAFLERVSLVSDVDAVESSAGAVTLMTLHAAKGLEFPVVAIMGVEDGLLPHMQSQESQRQLEEERRLLFVGITRARQHLLLTHTQFRTVFGSTQTRVPSRFLAEIPEEVVQRFDGGGGEPLRTGTDDGESPDGPTPLRRGGWVRHNRFGLGCVLQVSGAGSTGRAQIKFERAGVKTLMLAYARLEQVDADAARDLALPDD